MDTSDGSRACVLPFVQSPSLASRAIYSLTPVQACAARIFAELWDVLGRQPSLRELAAELSSAKNTAQGLIRHLARRGWLARVFGPDSRGVHGWSWRLTRIPPPLPLYEFEVTEDGKAWLAANG